jgi:hypothetical protein
MSTYEMHEVIDRKGYALTCSVHGTVMRWSPDQRPDTKLLQDTADEHKKKQHGGK